MIGRNGERRSGISAQAARHDDDDDDKYLGKLEADTIKQVEKKEEILKSISGQGENFPEPNSTAGISSKE